jgi:hypothetical protein
MRTRQAENFWKQVSRAGPTECWSWQGRTCRKGYGRFGNRLAHRVAFQLDTGSDPGSLLVCHHCDNPPCCNPAHLFLGTAQDNSDDMKAKDRQNKARGEDASRAVLTEVDVIAIRNSPLTHKQLAEQYGVSQSAIALARRAKNWQHLQEEAGSRRHLTPMQVQEIRCKLRQGWTGRELALAFDVSEGTISLIRNKRIWKHV